MLGLEPLLLGLGPVAEVVLSLVVPPLLLNLSVLQLQSSSLRTGLLTTDTQVFLLQLTNSFLEVLEWSLRDAEVVDLLDTVATGAVVDLL